MGKRNTKRKKTSKEVKEKKEMKKKPQSHAEPITKKIESPIAPPHEVTELNILSGIIIDENLPWWKRFYFRFLERRKSKWHPYPPNHFDRRLLKKNSLKLNCTFGRTTPPLDQERFPSCKRFIELFFPNFPKEGKRNED